MHLKIIHDKIKIHGIGLQKATIMSLEEILARQEALARLEEQEGRKAYKAPKHPRAGTGRGNSLPIKVLRAEDTEGNILEVTTAEAVDNYQWLSPKQKKARRKYDRRKERKQIEALAEQVEDF